MSARAARLLAVPFALLAFVLRIYEALWLEPLTWGIEPSAAGVLAALGLVLGALAVPLLTYRRLTRAAREIPSAWRIDTEGRRFFVEPAPVWKGSFAIMLAWLAPGAIPMERVPHEEQRRIAEFGAYTTAGEILAVLLLLLALVMLLVNRPSLALDADGVTVQWYLRRTGVRWADTPALRIPGRGLAITSRFLAFSIDTYRDDPEARNRIGTIGEADRLESAFRSGG